MTPRETIYSKLYGLLSGSSSFTTSSRRLKHWADVGQAEQPALFMSQDSEDAISSLTNVPPKYVMRVSVYIYAYEPDETLPPSSRLNPLVDAALESIVNPINPQSLGGLVVTVQVDGKIVYDEGVLGNQAVAIIPMKILVG